MYCVQYESGARIRGKGIQKGRTYFLRVFFKIISELPLEIFKGTRASTYNRYTCRGPWT